MSDIALNLLDRLRQRGVKDDDARDIAQSLDRRVEDAIAHADRHRADIAEHRKENRAEFAELRKENRALHRILITAVVAGMPGSW